MTLEGLALAWHRAREADRDAAQAHVWAREAALDVDQAWCQGRGRPRDIQDLIRDAIWARAWAAALDETAAEAWARAEALAAEDNRPG